MDGAIGLVYIIVGIFWGVIWGIATQKVNENKGYYGGFGLGFFLGLIGLIIVLCKPDNRYAPAQTQYSPMYPTAYSEAGDRKMLENGGWKCKKCGRINPSYTGTCACGMTKGENNGTAKAIQQANSRAAEEVKTGSATQTTEKAQSGVDQELQNIQKLRSYKELLDTGVISQEEFDTKKAQLLKLD